MDRPKPVKGVFMKRFLGDLVFLGVVFGAMLLGILGSGCATVKPGQDPILVHAQQTLAGATPVFDGAMKWYFANAKGLAPSATAVFEKVRTGYGPAYKALDDAVDAYKAGKTVDLPSLEASLTSLITDAVNLVATLKGKPSAHLFLPFQFAPPIRIAWAGGL
jgi:hypothetical protein